MAILISNVGLVFEFAAAIACSFLSFIMPGMFFIISEKKFSSRVDAESRKWTRFGAYCFIVLGIVVFLVLITDNII